MKIKNILLLSLLSVAFLPSCGDSGKYYLDHSTDEEEQPQDTENTIFTIANYNVRVQSDEDTDERSWNVRKEYFMENVTRNKFDIFGTEEATASQLADLGALTEYAHFGAGRDGGNNGEHSAIFYRKNRFTLLDNGDFWFSETPNLPSKGWDAALNRICSWGKFRDNNTQKEFYVFNSHFDHKGVTARIESAKLLVNKVKEIAGNTPTFCTGDLNVTPDNQACYFLSLGGLSDAYTVTKSEPVGTYWTFNGYDLTLTDSKSRIDYIWCTAGITVYSYTTVNDDITQKRYGSDHFPVMAKVELP